MRSAPGNGSVGDGKLTALMITAFIDMVGVFLVIPILPFYVKEMGAGPHAGLVVGMLVAVFSVAQLVSAPMWGRFSDKYGRRPALMVGLTASTIAYIIFAFAGSIWLLFLSRIVQGAGGGTVGVIQAYVADSVKPDQRARALGWLSAATNLGVTLGPVFGSLATAHGRHAPGLCAAGLCILNITFAWHFLVESRDMTEAKAHAAKPRRSMDAILRVITHSNEPAPRLIWIYAVGMGAFSGVMAILALFLSNQFGVTADTIGVFFGYIGAIAVLTRLFILGWAVDRFGEARLSRFGAALLATGLATMPFMHLMPVPPGIAGQLVGFPPKVAHAILALFPFLPLALPVALIPLGTAFTFPCVTSLLSRVTPSNERGLYMGLQQTYGGVARVLFPLMAGRAFDWVVPLPFLVSATMVAGTIVLGLGLDRYARDAPSPAGPVQPA